LLTGFKLWRKAAIAMASYAVSFAKACQGMIGARMRPSAVRRLARESMRPKASI
jgi:hypothetical protein